MAIQQAVETVYSQNHKHTKENDLSAASSSSTAIPFANVYFTPIVQELKSFNTVSVQLFVQFTLPIITIGLNSLCGPIVTLLPYR
ncbi:hypothetical protein T11_1721 [Trichinella zimbabwensis]|uniref:Uncharacterized protein n=1 Tax=Trichinella zimbabwensis TaxID=268475 RepID=A0A0V1HHL1_9BILA|nr:hypothetical protein T11_1721 [Trichinella zimbabwensis]